jgi:hypothetical protein
MKRMSRHLPGGDRFRARLSRLFVMGLLVVAALTAVTQWPHAQALAPQPAGPVAMTASPVPLNPSNPGQDRVGRFVYAGGLSLSAPPRFGGLSDIAVMADGRAVIVTDEGQFYELRIVLDASGRLASIADARRTPLVGLDGRPLSDKTVADSEGVALLSNGDRLVSFERQHRIWRYPSGGGPPVPAPAPDTAPTFPPNAGLEALAVLPGGTGSAYLAGSEGGSQVWQCRLDDGCRETALGKRVPDDYGLTAMAASPDGATLALLARSFSPERGVRVVVRLAARAAIDSASAPLLDELVLGEPLTRDNFEGMALVNGREAGGLRLYLLSDNNFSDSQKTYLLAFDWKK